MATTNNPLVGSSSCLIWFGGDMPRGGGSSSDPQAVTDLTAWAAAGSPNN